jgi:hypothetical protein
MSISCEVEGERFSMSLLTCKVFVALLSDSSKVADRDRLSRSGAGSDSAITMPAQNRAIEVCAYCNHGDYGFLSVAQMCTMRRQTAVDQ